jgi:hypothetical protein
MTLALRMGRDERKEGEALHPAREPPTMLAQIRPARPEPLSMIAKRLGLLRW